MRVDMKIDVRTHSFDLSPSMRRQIERRLYIALHAFSRYIESVSVSIRDVNGPRGGRDKLSQVIVRFWRGTPIVVTGKGESLYPLMSQLAAAARRTVKSRIRRRRTRAIRQVRRRNQSLPTVSTSESAQWPELHEVESMLPA